MGHRKPPPDRADPSPPRHALEAADAGGQRTVAAVRRVAGRLAAALTSAADAIGGLHFTVTDLASGRRDQCDSLFDGDADITAITIEPVHAPALLLIDHQLSAMLVERHYGGRVVGADPIVTRRAGLAEAREVARIADMVAIALEQSCDDRVPLSAARLGTLSAEDATAMLAPGEAVARISFAVALGQPAATCALTLLLPLAALRAASVLQVALVSREPAARQRWQQDLARRADDIALPARSVIARPLLSLHQLMALRPGDVIPIGMPRQVPLLVADRRIATGTIGERDGRVAFMIDHLEREDAR